MKRKTENENGKLRKNGFQWKKAAVVSGKVRKSKICRSILWFSGLWLLGMIMQMAVQAARWNHLQQGIAGEVLRFHVLAQSNEEEDQRVKYEVRDEVLSWLNQELKQQERELEHTDRKWVLEQVEKKLNGLEQTANRVLIREKKSYRARAEVKWCYFPDRTYGSCTFPAGWYQALQIRLGEAKGKNWWCVLYPELCFSDCAEAVMEEGQMKKLKEVLTAEEYEMILQKPEQWKVSFRWF